MKSKTSLFNKAVARRNLTGHMGLWAGCLFIWLMILPLNVYFQTGSVIRFSNMELLQAEELAEMKSSAMIERVLWDNMEVYLVLFAGIALVCAIVSFSYLFTARNANMMHTYPVNRMSLFCTNYLSGLLYQIVPVLAGVLAALVTGAGMGALSGEVVKQYLLWTGVAIAESVFFYSLAVCVLMFCGNMVAVAVFYLCVNFLYAIVLMTIEAVIESVCYGVSQGLSDLASDSVLTPVVYLARHVSLLIKESGYVFTGTKTLAGYLAAAVALVVIAVITYQKKHLETAGDVITVEWLKPLFRWIVSACTSAMCAVLFIQITYQRSIGAVLVSGAVMGAIAFFVAQMLIERTLRVFTKKRIREGIVFVVCMCGFYIGLDMDIIGLETKIPAVDEIQAVNINGRIELYAMSEDEIDWIRNIHGQIIDSRKDYENSINTDTFISMDYYLKNGRHLRRFYSIPSGDDSAHVIKQLDEYAAKPDIILKRYFGIHYPDVDITAAYLDDYNDPEGSIRIPENKAIKLYQALVKDAEAGNLGNPSDPQTQTSEEAEKLESKYLTFDVLDPEGFITPEILFYSTMTESSEKGETMEIWLSPEYENLISEMKELGYLNHK